MYLIFGGILFVLWSICAIGSSANSTISIGYDYKQWTFQAQLVVPEAAKYGNAPFGLAGRGFVRLVSGYSTGPLPSDVGVYIHTTDDGILRTGGLASWTVHAKLRPASIQATVRPGEVASAVKLPDGFGSWLVGDASTIIVSAPGSFGASGAVYIFNGTLRHWTQIQTLAVSTAVAAAPGIYTKDFDGGDKFGGRMVLQDDRLLISSEGSDQAIGAAFVFERNTKTLTWSLQQKLVSLNTNPGSHISRASSLYGNTAILS